MSPESIAQTVQDHYAATQEPLLLSALGTRLQKEGSWPIEGEERSLADLIESSLHDLVLVRDPDANAYVVVVPKGREYLAENAIKRRHQLQELRSLARPLLLAFCVNAPAGAGVYVQRDPPPRYVIGSPPDAPGFLPVEPQFRNPGLFLDFNRQLDVGVAERVLGGIREWARLHGIELQRARNTGKRPEVAIGASVGVDDDQSNALARLLAAQPPEFAGRLVVPLIEMLIKQYAEPTDAAFLGRYYPNG